MIPGTVTAYLAGQSRSYPGILDAPRTPRVGVVQLRCNLFGPAQPLRDALRTTTTTKTTTTNQGHRWFAFAQPHGGKLCDGMGRAEEAMKEGRAVLERINRVNAIPARARNNAGPMCASR